MSRSTWERLSAASGMGFAVGFIAAFLVVGDIPKLGDSAQETAAWYSDNRGRALVGIVVFGVALMLFVWFVGTLANTLREAGEGRPGAVVIAAGGLIAAFASMQGIIVASLAQSLADTADPGVVKALGDIQWLIQTLVGFPATVFAAASGIAILRSGILARWLGWASIAGAVVFAVSTTTFARDGFWAPDGGYNYYIAPIVFIAWVAATSALLLQRAAAREEKPMAAPMPA